MSERERIKWVARTLARLRRQQQRGLITWEQMCRRYALVISEHANG